MKTSRFLMMLALGVLLGLGAGLAPSARADEQWISGGFGMDERAAMEARQDYNLLLQFAETSGSYIGDVAVSIKGPVSLEAVSPGPWFLAKLPAGTYAVTATYEGKTKSVRLDVPATGRRKQALFW